MFFLRCFQIFVFYASYFVFPVLIFLIWMLVFGNHWIELNLLIILVFLSLLFIYARFVEPNCIIVRHEKFFWGKKKTRIRIAVVSDLHLGVFKKRGFLKRVLEKTRFKNPDLLIVTGDLINEPAVHEFGELFSPFRTFDIPTFVVTGNHDSKMPGSFSSAEVRRALRGMVFSVDNAHFRFSKKGEIINIIGISDLNEGKSDYSVLRSACSDQFNLLITHNPDTACELPLEVCPKGSCPHLLISGHTHGGQVYAPAPFIHWIIPCKYRFLRGWYDVEGLPVYVTSGLGEVIFPFRFLVPPEIVIIDLYL